MWFLFKNPVRMGEDEPERRTPSEREPLAPTVVRRWFESVRPFGP